MRFETVTTIYMFFTEKNRKKNLILSSLALLLFCGVVFLSQTHLVHAAWYNPADWVRSVLYGIFTVFGLFASLAVTIFEWAINPTNVNLLFNSKGVYESWKFIRDFFNLFFILILLYTAFKVVFQIEHNFKKTLLSIILAALYINFSFPVTRVLIDVTNVPMYFFANQLAARDAGSSGTGVFGATMTASNIEGILLPKGSDTEEFSRLFMSIIFLFIFSMTLLVLSIMFVIRLVALVVLVIFSSVGFAASIVPGLESYSKKWWDNFWKYAFFGPTAMLMLVVAVRFFASISDTTSDLRKSMDAVASSTTGLTDVSFYSSMLMFSIPIIMLWIAMGLAQSSSIMGAGMVVGKGKAFSKWVGKKSYNNTLTRGIGGGIKARAEKNKVLKFATPKYWKDSSQQSEERLSGLVGGGRAGRNRVIENQHNKKVSEAEKKMEEERTKDTELFKKMTDTNGKPADREAAARLLSKKDKLTDAVKMKQAADAMSAANAPEVAQEKTAELVKKAGGEIYTNGVELATAIGLLGNDTKAVAALIDKASGAALGDLNNVQYGALTTPPPAPTAAALAAATPADRAEMIRKDAEANRTTKAIKAKLDSKLRKEGKTDILIRAEMAASPAGGPMIARQNAINKILKGMTTAEIANQQMFSSLDPDILAAAQNHLTLMRVSHPEKYQKVRAELP